MSYAIMNIVYGVDATQELGDNSLFYEDLDILRQDEALAVEYYESGVLIGTDFGHPTDALGTFPVSDIYQPTQEELAAAEKDFREKLQVIADHPDLSDEFKERVLKFVPAVQILISYS